MSDYPCIGDIVIKTEPSDIHRCPNEKCGRKFKLQRSLAVHLKYECGLEPQFHCAVCNKSFKQRFTYKTHMFNAHHKAIVI